MPQHVDIMFTVHEIGALEVFIAQVVFDGACLPVRQGVLGSHQEGV